MAHPRRRALAIAALGALMSLSCIAPCIRGPRRATPAPTVPVSDDAARRFEDKTQGLSGEEFRLEFTEEEVTSYLALRLGDALPIASPQVRFLPGRLVVEGDLTSPVRGHVILTGTIVVADGRPEIQFQEASVGGIPVPRSLLASLSDTLSESISTGDQRVDIQKIELQAGRAVITGRAARP